MPGSARRLKKKLQEVTSPSPPSSSATSPTPGPEPHKSGSFAEGISNLLHPGSHHHKSNSTGQAQAQAPGVTSGEPVHPISSAQSGDSVASNPNNYMTDEQLEQDLVLEEMAERQGSIGHQSPPGGSGGPAPVSTQGLSHAQSAPPQLPPSAGASHPAPPPPVDQGKSGGMYGHGLFGGNGNGSGSKKKSSKQKFAERQVGPKRAVMCCLTPLTPQARKKDALLNSAPPSDPDWTAQLEKERQEEIQVIGDACDVLGREIYEVRPGLDWLGLSQIGTILTRIRSRQMGTACSIPSRTSSTSSVSSLHTRSVWIYCAINHCRSC